VAFPHDVEIFSSLATRHVLQEQIFTIVADALEQDILHEVLFEAEDPLGLT
jgi:hypothetical protein